MADIRLSFSIAMVAAVVLGELFSLIWYNLLFRRDYGERNLIMAILADVGLAFILNHIMGQHWSVRNIEDAVWLSIWLGCLYICLESPHHLWHQRDLTRFLIHALHKFGICFVMVFSLDYFKNY
ncbi:unnamed protein product [Owenia fusiformis]|uniref:Uncharacterized protein n=1 Tax=Owenia fusiformis TaxID=6347 RepID=A0A8S4N1M2_OWEFU|nr:unnamed protein product [Owenia fusiformis]